MFVNVKKTERKSDEERKREKKGETLHAQIFFYVACAGFVSFTDKY